MPRIYVVDDDEPLRAYLKMLLQADHDVMCFAAARHFLDVAAALLPGCLILDVRMPEMNGLELQRRLTERNLYFPIVMMTGLSDVPIAVEAMKAGAVDFIEKPFRRKDILESIRLAQDRFVPPRAQDEQAAIEPQSPKPGSPAYRPASSKSSTDWSRACRTRRSPMIWG